VVRILSGAVVFDSELGQVTRADVALADGLIVRVGPGLEGQDRVDCSGGLLVPGFIDCHAHVAFPRWPQAPRSARSLSAVPALSTLLRSGVTTVRDAWGADSGLTFALREGWFEGPELLLTLRQLSTTGGIGDPWRIDDDEFDRFADPAMPSPVFDGPDQARAAVRRMVRAGANWIKLVASGGLRQGRRARDCLVSEVEMHAVVEEARSQGRQVMVHSHGAEAARSAAVHGARSIEHGTWLDDEAIRAMRDNGTWLVPTLSVTQAPGAGIDEEIAAAHRRSVGAAINAGVNIACGSDAPMQPYGDVLREIHYLAQTGLGAVDALRAATIGAAELLGLQDRIGSIKEGKQADLVLLDGEDLDLVDLSGRVRAVWKGGQCVRNDLS